MIEIKGLYKKFGKVEVLKDLDLSISGGGIFTVLGPNGSGKTTLIKCLLGMVIPNSGEIQINGNDIIREFEYRNQIAYLPQIATFPSNLSVSELITMIQDLRTSENRTNELVCLFGLEEYMNQKLGNLSGGTRQKVNLVLSFMFDSPLIILDEPTSGLDPVSLIHLKELIQKEKDAGKTILITSHIMSFVDQVADQVVFLLDGKIRFQGELDALKRQTGETELEKAIANLLSAAHV